MDDLARGLAALREDVAPAWSDARGERLYAGIGQLRRRRRIRKAGSISVVALAACGALYLRSHSTEAGNPVVATRSLGSAPSATLGVAKSASQPLSTAQTQVQAEARAATFVERPATTSKLAARESMQLADGSHIGVTSTDGELAIERNERDHIDVRLASGVGHFDVVPNTHRHFVVSAGSVEVAVVGTAFDVERSQGRVRVSVSHGKVRVSSINGVALVAAGESSWFDEFSEVASDVAASDAIDNANSGVGVVPRARVPRPKHSAGRDEAPRAVWRSLSQSGDYEGAYQLLAQGTAVDDNSEALMDAADAARLSGHPDASVTYLRKVLRNHRESPVAPLAAFTLGRVLLERLGQPSEAADAFATARGLAPEGSLAQDALAREVEAWSKAGHPHEAYERARLYVENYPRGRRLRAVQLYGGLRAE
jgi:transmembrane sensor